MYMKYEFKKIDVDTTELCYKDKSLKIKKDIALMQELQSAVFKAKRKMVFDLAKEGLTKKDLVISKKEGNTILKTRYKFFEENQVVAIDVFKGELEGLVYMEIEFANEQEANSYQEPNWIIKDVTNDRRFKNQELAQFGMPEIN